MTATKCTKKLDVRAKLLFANLNLLVFLPFSLPSPSPLLKLPNGFLEDDLAVPSPTPIEQVSF